MCSRIDDPRVGILKVGAAGSVYGFSADGQTIYGMRTTPPDGRVELFSLGVSGGEEKTIG